MISEHETLLTLEEAAADFGGVKVPVVTVQRWVYQGIKGLKLESVLINKRYTSKEAVRRFIERRQDPYQVVEKPKVNHMTPKDVEEGLRRHGLIK